MKRFVLQHGLSVGPSLSPFLLLRRFVLLSIFVSAMLLAQLQHLVECRDQRLREPETEDQLRTRHE